MRETSQQVQQQKQHQEMQPGIKENRSYYRALGLGCLVKGNEGIDTHSGRCDVPTPYRAPWSLERTMVEQSCLLHLEHSTP